MMIRRRRQWSQQRSRQERRRYDAKIKRNLNETLIYEKNSIVIIYRLLLKYNI